jgi:carbonic anhydrase
MYQLASVSSVDDIPPEMRDTPVGLLLEYHNLKRDLSEYTQAELLIGMCMDNRKRLRLPDNFAYVIRTGGANLRYSEFKVSFAIGVGGVRSIALIGHTNCGMVNLRSKEEAFVDGLVERAGWPRERAEEHFSRYEAQFEIGNEIEFVCSEADRLSVEYPEVQVFPLIYRVEDNLLHLIREA